MFVWVGRLVPLLLLLLLLLLIANLD